jgi:hypothetical protein
MTITDARTALISTLKFINRSPPPKSSPYLTLNAGLEK